MGRCYALPGGDHQSIAMRGAGMVPLGGRSSGLWFTVWAWFFWGPLLRPYVAG
ncbi:hypothetical protein [Candidatus Viridilinea mediisalina]|uniref:hypothetical protein n=1 Tax=Candidatus Viridilinea mediisalina TaxID=2024553 RepID=UPI0013FE2F2A|nr:hypothetical protein [Candidatus Viridilinea mediisalina]